MEFDGKNPEVEIKGRWNYHKRKFEGGVDYH